LDFTIRPSRPRQQEHQVQFFVNRLVPGIIVHLADPREIGHRAIIEEHIDASEAIHRRGYEPLALGLVREIQRMDGHHATTRLLDQAHGLLCTRHGDIAADHIGALSREAQRRGTPDAAA
jgi:hypothetical protein